MLDEQSLPLSNKSWEGEYIEYSIWKANLKLIFFLMQICKTKVSENLFRNLFETDDLNEKYGDVLYMPGS